MHPTCGIAGYIKEQLNNNYLSWFFICVCLVEVTLLILNNKFAREKKHTLSCNTDWPIELHPAYG